MTTTTQCSPGEPPPRPLYKDLSLQILVAMLLGALVGHLLAAERRFAAGRWATCSSGWCA